MRIKDYVLPVVAVLLALLYFLTTPKDNEKKEFLIDNKIKIDQIKYKSDDLDITFENQDGKWMIVKPEVWPANSSQIKKLADTLKETEIVAEIKDSDDKKYEFDKGDTLILNDGKIKLIIGKKDKSYRLVYVKKDGKIYLVNSAFTNYLPLTLNQIKDKTVYKIGDNLKRFELNLDNEKIVLEKGSDGYFYNGRKLSDKESECIISKVSTLKANTFADNNTLPKSAEECGYLYVVGEKFNHKFTFYKDKEGDYYVPYKKQVFDIYSFSMEDFIDAIKGCVKREK